MAKKLRVKKWIATGELQVTGRETQDEILEHCGRLLDASCTSKILGEVLFQATNGMYYTVTVEAIIGRASKSFTEDTIEAHKDDEPEPPRSRRRETNPMTGPGDAIGRYRDQHPVGGL